MPHRTGNTVPAFRPEPDVPARVHQALEALSPERYGLLRNPDGSARFVPPPRTEDRPNPAADVSPETFLRLTRERVSDRMPREERGGRAARTIRAEPELACCRSGEQVLVVATLPGIAPLEFRMPRQGFTRDAARRLAHVLFDEMGVGVTRELRVVD